MEKEGEKEKGKSKLYVIIACKNTFEFELFALLEFTVEVKLIKLN